MLTVLRWPEVFVYEYSHSADGSNLLQRQHDDLRCPLLPSLDQSELPALNFLALKLHANKVI